MVGNFNADLDKPEGTTRAEKIAAALASASLEDTITHFLTRSKTFSRYRCTCNILHGEQVVLSRTEWEV